MIYGFVYVALVFGIVSIWLLLAVLPRPEFIEKPLVELKKILKRFLG